MIQPIDRFAALSMVLLCALWGSQQVLIKITAAWISPLLQVGLRSGIAVSLIAIAMIFRRKRVSLSCLAWRPGIIVGFLFGLDYLLICIGLHYTSASRMVMFIYSAPIFAAFGLHWAVPGQRLILQQWLGVAVAFGGIAMAFSDKPAAVVGTYGFIGDACGLTAGALWGAVTVLLRSTRLASAPPLETLVYQLGGSFLVLTGGSLWLGETAVSMDGFFWFSLTVQTLLIALGSFFLWMTLLAKYNATALGTLSFMTPLFGVMFGVLFLDESIGPGFIGGAIGVLAGIVLVNFRRTAFR